ncbi:uncharacterized protein [Dysidea avara]
MLHCLIENYTEDVAGFCDVLERIVNVPSLDVTINNLRKASTNLSLMQSQFNAILCSLPDNFLGTLDVLQDDLTDDCVCTVVECSDSQTANKLMLNCLIESYTEDIAGFCDALEKLTDAIGLANIVDILKKSRETMLTGSHGLSISRNEPTRPEQLPTQADEISVPKTSKKSTVPANQSHSGNDVPQLRELYRHIVPVYASVWKDLGLELEIPMYTLNAIAVDHASHPSSSTECCKAMLQKWIRMSPRPTWARLEEALGHLPEPLHPGCKSIRYQEPPLLPPFYIPRHELLEELVTAILTTELDPTRMGSTVTVTGVGGFGKTTLVIALCYHDAIKAKFKSGFVFAELGPQACHPLVKLNELYYQLTGTQFPTKSLTTDNLVKEIRQITTNQCNKMLVIIDDVWQVEDAEPIVRAFSNCKTIVTTRKNDIQREIPSKEHICAGPMTQYEAVSLLTSGKIFESNLSVNDCKLLNELAHDVHLWPLLLCLVRGQLAHYIIQYGMVSHDAIKMVNEKLYEKGLTAFDREKTDRKYAVKACIEVTLDLVEESTSSKLKAMIISTGIGYSIPVSILYIIWNITPLKATEVIDKIWDFGLVMLSNCVILPFGVNQRHITIHAVISQYIMENISSIEVVQLYNHTAVDSTLRGKRHIIQELAQEFNKCFGSPDLMSMNDVDFLKYFHSLLQYCYIPDFLRHINALNMCQPHEFIVTLEALRGIIADTFSTNVESSPALSILVNQQNILINECQSLLKNSCKASQPLYQIAAKCLLEQNYNDLIQELEDNCHNQPIFAIAEKCVNIINQMIGYDCAINNGALKALLEKMIMNTSSYHPYVLFYLPLVKVNIEFCQRILHVLESCSLVDIREMVDYIKSGKLNGVYKQISNNFVNKIQQVSPSYFDNVVSWMTT